MMTVPDQLRIRPNWIVWRSVKNGNRTAKIPLQAESGHLASTVNERHWTTFERATIALSTRQYSGLGYVFRKDDGVFGLDLDNCVDGLFTVKPWARDLLDEFRTFAEWSPSKRGIHLYGLGACPRSHLVIPQGCGRSGEKRPAIELHAWGQFYAFTGDRVEGQPLNVFDCPTAIGRFLANQERHDQAETFKGPAPAIADELTRWERGRKYLAKVPPAINGEGGCHRKTFRAACVLIGEIGLSKRAAYTLLQEWNQRCDPPWSDREILHKVEDAAKKAHRSEGGLYE